MCKFIRRIICLAVIAFIGFYAIVLWSGGEKFRWFGEKTGGVIKESGEELGRRADEIKKTEDNASNKVKKLTGAEDSKTEKSKTTPKPKPESESSLRSIWKQIREKIGTWIKGQPDRE